MILPLDSAERLLGAIATTRCFKPGRRFCSKERLVHPECALRVFLEILPTLPRRA